MDRRSFFASGLAAAAARGGSKKYRAAIIGHTGRGDYGHSWETSFREFENVEVVAVADPVEAGRKTAAAHSRAKRDYADYHEMLRTEKPDIVGIFPRWLDQHAEMFVAAAGAGAHIIMEKPFARDLREADAMVEAAERNKIKVQVGHTARTSRVTRRVAAILKSGEIGMLLEIRARGKEDKRAGGEDMMVLGTHIFDLMRFFSGDPTWVFAHVTQDGQEITEGQARDASEPIGKVTGDEIAAMFAFPGGVHGYFASRRNDQVSGPRFGITLAGSKGILYMPLTSVPSGAPYLLKSPSWVSDKEAWQRVEVEDGEKEAARSEANTLMVADLLEAIEKNREPACSARDGRWAVEMVMGTYQAQKTGARMSFPLKNRRHPLAS